jgi:hypothetical protein
MMHVIDVLLDSFTRLFRHHRYSPLEKLYSMGAGETGDNLLPRNFRNRELKNRTKRFYNNVNAKTLKSIEEIATAVQLCITS